MTDGPVVVLVLSHRDPPLVRRLVDRLTAGSNTAVVVHHDPTGPALSLPRSDAVMVMPDPQHAAWGRMTFPLTILRGLRFALDRQPDLSWVLVVSGQDYPTRSAQSIEADLAEAPADAFLRHFRVDPTPENDVHPWQALTRRRYLQKLRLPGTYRSVPFPRRHPFNKDLSLYVGDVWVNLGAAAVAHVLEQQQRLARLERYFSHCSCPDEGLLTTLLLNDAEHLRIVDDRRRYISWSGGTAHPEYLVAEDVEKAVGSTALFARKADSEKTPEVLDLFDSVAGIRG